MTTPLILDIAILAILLCFVIGGARVGFVRSLCSFLAVFVAFFGACFLARALTPVFTELAAPHALPAIVERLEGGGKSAKAETEFEVQESGILPKSLGLPEAWGTIITKLSAEADPVRQPFTSPSQALAQYILRIVVFGAIFSLAFILLLVLWTLLSRSLDLVAKLPVLNVCNRSLGALLGLVKGLLLLFVLRWVLCDLTGVLPQALWEETLVFRWLAGLLEGAPLRHFLL